MTAILAAGIPFDATSVSTHARDVAARSPSHGRHTNTIVPRAKTTWTSVIEPHISASIIRPQPGGQPSIVASRHMRTSSQITPS